jgi:hypothetical protein
MASMIHEHNDSFDFGLSLSQADNRGAVQYS